MKVVWKDTQAKTCPPMLYRNHTITRYEKDDLKGWVTDFKDDSNVYATQDHARNAINKALGGKPRKDGSRLQKAGIKIIGTK